MFPSNSESRELQITRLRAECGCEAGGIAGLIAFGLSVIVIITGRMPAAMGPAEQWMGALAVAIAASVSAKAFAIMRARLQLRRLLARSARVGAMGMTITLGACVESAPAVQREPATVVVIGAPSFRPVSARTAWSLTSEGPVAVVFTPPITSTSRLVAVIPPGAIADGRSIGGLSCVVKDASTSGEVFVRLYRVDPLVKRSPANLDGGQVQFAEVRTGGSERTDNFASVAAVSRGGLPARYSSTNYYFLEFTDSPGHACNGDRPACALSSCTIHVE